MSSTNLDKADYEEPVCLICDPRTGERKNTSSIPMQRIVDKLEEYCTLKDFAGAERHLGYWLSEAQAQGDLRGQFSLRNEMMGFYRKQGEYDKAVASVNEAVRLMQVLDNEDSISGATCHVNCGTVYDTFSEPENALLHFTKAEEIFAGLAFKDLFRLGSLYNNMALAYMELGQYPEAFVYYAKALNTMEQLSGSELEQAITYLNMADCSALEKGLDGASGEISAYLEKAKNLIDTEGLNRDGYYAFVCEKCSPGFNCYGDFDYAEELDRRAADIYNKAKGSE
ncbi:MAG: tetratricopeptide repeat protein [Lachnospiraceae bacterium]|nr:tetratricopeptide repeat protein [Lachnospiraceae bacterium]